MKPRHCVVTGASGGIGEAIARTLLARGHQVTLVARAGDRLQAAATRLLGDASPERVHVEAADLALQSEVRRLASALATRPIDSLVLNAALMPGERRITGEGVEETLAVNHLAPYLLTRLLLPGLTPGARVVIVGADPSMLARETCTAASSSSAGPSPRPPIPSTPIVRNGCGDRAQLW